MAVRTAGKRLTRCAWWCLGLAALAGCRNLDNAQVDVLERELRRQEDYIYELEDYLVEYSEKLRQARMVQCQPASTSSTSTTTRPKGPLLSPTLDDDEVERPTLPLNGRAKLTAPPVTEAPLSAPPAAAEAPAASAAATAPPAEAPPAAEQPVEAAPEPVAPEEMEAPELEIGDELGATTPASPAAQAAGGPLLIPDPIDYQTEADAGGGEATSAAERQAEPVEPASGGPRLAAPIAEAPRLSADRLEVRQVFGNATAPGASPGSLLVVVEALNATDEPGDATGAASLMIMTRDAAGGLKRLHRWDFTPEETAAAWQSSPLGDGLHLELPLAGAALPEGELELWARVVDDGGSKLLTSAEAPYRFQAEQLASIEQAEAEAALAATEAPAAGGAVTTAAVKAADADAAPAGEAASPQPQWRASAIRVDADRVEGFATTGGSSTAPAGWSTKPLDAGAPASTAASTANGPKWKRSSSAAAATASRPAWSAGR